MTQKAAPFPMGVTVEGKKVQFTVETKVDEEVTLCLYDKKGNPAEKVPFPKDSHFGAVSSMQVEGIDTRRLLYCYEVGGSLKKDPYGRYFPMTEGGLPLAAFVNDKFDWEGDAPLRLPLSDMVMYHIHTKGFTAHPSCKGRKKGTFAGVLERMDYLKELGVNALEFMPVYDYEEMGGNGTTNYWGYGPASYFAPKASFGRPEDLKRMIKTLHQNGIEVILELFFQPGMSIRFILDVVNFWVWEYHADGIHIIGDAPLYAIEKEGMLRTTKLFAADWGEGYKERPKHLCRCNDGFLVDMRQFLKGDEDTLHHVIERTTKNPADCGVVNYMAGVNGFTLYDNVSYDQKHNEKNGENNHDGNSYNYSWNCGVEGPTKRKKISELRKSQIRNALTMLYLSQGIPMLLSGDEMGQTKQGNNNTYCQDNELSWINWNNQRTNKDILAFTKAMIAFRKAHPVFHTPEEPKMLDYKGKGHPDLSIHGVKPWYPEYDNFRRQIGLLYHGSYANDDNFYVMYNMHWEPHEFFLPSGDKKEKWHLAVCTTDKEVNGIYPAGEEPELSNQKSFMVDARSIVVLIGKASEK